LASSCEEPFPGLDYTPFFIYNTSNHPDHSYSPTPRASKVSIVITNRPDSLQRQRPAELSNSKAIHQAGQRPPRTDHCSFRTDELKLIRINKFAGNLQRKQPEK